MTKPRIPLRYLREDARSVYITLEGVTYRPGPMVDNVKADRLVLAFHLTSGHVSVDGVEFFPMDAHDVGDWDARMLGLVVNVDRVTGTERQKCNLGCIHSVVQIRRFPLRYSEVRCVADLFTEEWSDNRTSPVLGWTAVDSSGREWTRDWNGRVGDQPGPWRSGRFTAQSPSFSGVPRDSAGGAYQITQAADPFND